MPRALAQELRMSYQSAGEARRFDAISITREMRPTVVGGQQWIIVVWLAKKKAVVACKRLARAWSGVMHPKWLGLARQGCIQGPQLAWSIVAHGLAFSDDERQGQTGRPFSDGMKRDMTKY